MKNYLLKASKLMIMFLLLSLTSLIAQTNSRITGVVTDADLKEPLFGANISLIGKSMGAASDINGKYLITNVAPGEYTVKVSYLGYQSQETKITIAANRTLELNFKLVFEEVMGEAVIVTTQREGQLAAINQQLQSDAIKNVVSSEKIRELPEANAAEAVGRLSGVSLLREGGEGNKVVIRGLAPKYNKVQLDGVDMASTSSSDRSTDLSMISPYMLSGIEVTKSALADQEANQLGGTVNFVLKGAPFAAPSTEVMVEGGYNALKNTYNDYKVVLQHNRRLFENLIGISLNADIEKRNRSSNSVSSGYQYLINEKLAAVNSLSVSDVTRDLDRKGFSAILDLKTDLTNIKLSSMISSVKRRNITRNETSGGWWSGTGERSQNLTDSESNTTVFINKIALEQHIGLFKVDAGISFSFSENKAPEILNYGGVETAPNNPVNKYARPDEIPSFMKNNLSNITLDQLNISNYYNKETELSSYLDLNSEFAINDDISLKIKLGGKYKHKYRIYDYDRIFFPIQWNKTKANNALIAKYPWMKEFYTGGKFPYLPFIDNEFDPGDFMAGEFKLERIPKLNLGREMIYYLLDYLGVNWFGSTEPTEFVPNFHTSKMSDYSGTEDYFGAYIMPTLTIGKMITIIPGFRYEKNTTEYTGIRGNENLQRLNSKGYVHHDTTITRNNEFILPMIHLRIKPTEGIDIRASYTQTLSRPNYSEFIPSWNITQFDISYRNPYLKPSKSTNYDVYLSLYGNKLGLFTVGYFYKNIKDLIFSQNEIVIDVKMAEEVFGLYEKNTGQKPSRFVSKPIYSYVNNQNPVKVQGLELEWQTNFWFLPGLFNNIVFSINYTYTHSEVLYPRTVPIKQFVQTPLGKREVIVGNADSSFTAPLLLQPDHILNITLGYDYKDFSIRTSMQYKSDIFSSNSWRPELRASTDPFYIYDLSVSQKLPVEGLSIYGNIKNISKTIEGSSNNSTGYMTNREYYGMSAGFGVKYKF